MNKYEFRHARKGLFFLLISPLLFLITQTTAFDRGSIWHSFFYSIGGDIADEVAFWVLLAATFLVPFLIAFNAKGYGVLHRDYAEINLGFGIKVREIEYAKIKSVTHGFNRTGFNWLIEVSDESNILICLSASLKHNMELERFMKDLKQRLPKSRRG